MKKKQLGLVCGLMILLPSLVFAQEFKGTVLKSGGRPMKGVSITRKQTGESVQTDKSGRFSFKEIQPTDTLLVALSRKKAAAIPVGERNEVTIRIEKKFFVLTEGSKEEQLKYMKMFRTRYNSNVLTQEQILRMTPGNLYDIFRGGVMPGVSVNGNKISIRGGTSFDLDNEPLFVVDGTQYESSSEADSVVPVNDILKIEVQKDGSMYGLRGANGVIIITTVKK